MKRRPYKKTHKITPLNKEINRIGTLIYKANQNCEKLPESIFAYQLGLLIAKKLVMGKSIDEKDQTSQRVILSDEKFKFSPHYQSKLGE